LRAKYRFCQSFLIGIGTTVVILLNPKLFSGSPKTEREYLSEFLETQQLRKTDSNYMPGDSDSTIERKKKQMIGFENAVENELAPLEQGFKLEKAKIVLPDQLSTGWEREFSFRYELGAVCHLNVTASVGRDGRAIAPLFAHSVGIMT
jgi:hypothetical protein